MLFPILLILIPAVLIVALARWAKTDEDDLARKVVTSLVQISCLMCMALGVMRFAQRSAEGTASVQEDGTVASGGQPSRGPSSTTINNAPRTVGIPKPAIVPTAAEQIVAAQKAEENRQRAFEAQQALAAAQAEQNRRNLEAARRSVADSPNGQTGLAPPPPPSEANSASPPNDPNVGPGLPPPSAAQPGATPPAAPPPVSPPPVSLPPGG